MVPGLSILVVDDEPNIRKTLAIALEAEGQRVVASGTYLVAAESRLRAGLEQW